VYGATVIASGLTSLGHDTYVTADNATAIGGGVAITGIDSTAIGFGSGTIGHSSVALGKGAGTTGDAATAIGSGAGAIGTETVALGRSAGAMQNASIALGHNSYANATNAISIGTLSSVGHFSSIALGNSAQTTTDKQIVIGAAPAGALSEITRLTIPGMGIDWQNGPGTLAINAQTASYTAVLADSGELVEMNNASANNFTVPLNSSVAFAVGTQINILQTGAGQTTVVATSGVTINATPGLKLRAQWSSATLIKRATDTWVLVGDLSA